MKFLIFLFITHFSIDSTIESSTNKFLQTKDKVPYQNQMRICDSLVIQELQNCNDSLILKKAILYSLSGELRRRFHDTTYPVNFKIATQLLLRIDTQAYYLLLDTFNLLGQQAIRDKMYSLAFFNYFTMMQLASYDNTVNTYDSEAFLNIGMSHQNRGNYQKAIDYYLKSMQLRAEYSNDTALSLKRIDEFYAEQQENKELESDLEFTLYILTLIILLATVSLLLYLRTKSKNLLKEAENEQLKLNQELADQQLKARLNEIADISIITAQYHNSISEAKDFLKEENTKKALKVLNTLLKENDDWLVFKRLFDEMDPVFFEKLEEKHPNLTKSELKLCGMILMKLDTKDISRILNITPESVNKARY